MKRALLLVGLVLLVPLTAFASDGALEIHQACVATGCFPGDTAGFPVTTQSGRKYVLTSDLVVPNSATSAVTVAAASTLDLNGFSISGPNTCPGTPPVCGFANGGTGVTLGDGATVRNGTVRGMGGHGVVIGIDVSSKLAVVEDLWIDQNGAGGIAGGVSDGSIIRGCRVSRNGGTAIGLAGGNASPGSILSDNVIYGNNGVGIQVNSAVIRDNNIRSNAGLGLQIAYIDSSSGFGGNVINDNNGGNVNPQTSGGHQIATNVCGDKLTCP